MRTCKLVIPDEVNCEFQGLDPKTRRDCSNAVKYFVPHAKHTPAYRLGHWDGTVSMFAINGSTYVNVLDKILPIVMENGYDVQLEDHRVARTFEFPEITEHYPAQHMPRSTWPKGHPAEGKEIVLRDYQVNVIKTFLENPQSLQSIATGAGKCLTSETLLSIKIDEESQFGKFLKSKKLI